MTDTPYLRRSSFGFRREFALTEAEWASGDDPVAMLRHLGSDQSPRKLRLFAVACYRHVWDQLGNQARAAVELAEAYADGHVSLGELLRMQVTLRFRNLERCGTEDYAITAAHHAIGEVAGVLEFPEISWLVGRPEREAGLGPISAFLRDIFTPLRAAAPPVARLSVTALARAAYEDRYRPSGRLDTARLAILADALEENGCDDSHLLQHLRGDGPHVRGCWALDLILGKR